MIAKKTKFHTIDIFIILICVGAGIFIYYRIKYGLEYKWQWRAMPRFLITRNPKTGRLRANYLLQGLLVTLKLSAWSALIATIVGMIMGIFRTSKSLFLRMIGRTYVELIRNLPPLVLVFIFYFFIVDQIMPLLGIDNFIRHSSGTTQEILKVLFAKKSLFIQFLSGVMTIAFFEGAYITEIIRAGIESIERGQREAAYSLGLSIFDKMRVIIMPQAIRRVLPALANEFINTIKYSSLASLVSIQELTFSGVQLITATQYIFETWITVAVMYLSLTLSLSLVVAYIEKRMRKSD